MNERKIFLRLKNGKSITTHHRDSANIIYSVNLSYKNGLFKLHSYIFDGNDVLDEQSYKNESEIEVPKYEDFMNLILGKFPGIDIELA